MKRCVDIRRNDIREMQVKLNFEPLYTHARNSIKA